MLFLERGAIKMTDDNHRLGDYARFTFAHRAF